MNRVLLVPTPRAASAAPGSRVGWLTFRKPPNAAKLHAAHLTSARQNLLESPVPSKSRSLSRKSVRKYREVRIRLLGVLERVAEKGSERQVNLVLDAGALLTLPDRSDPASAEMTTNALRGDATLYDDADDWDITFQRIQIAPTWITVVIAFALAPLFFWLKGGIDVIYWEALLGGALGCFLDWNRSEPRKLSGSYWDQTFLRAFQPIASGLYGLLTVLALKSGILNLKPAGVSEPIYLFLAAVLAGYGGPHGPETMERLTKALSRRG